MTRTVTELTVPNERKLTVLFGLSNAYAVPVVKPWVRVMVPRIMPLPVRVVVRVTVFVPVSIAPLAMSRVATD